ncbi:MAG: glucosaminidase domain-containing protein [Mariprofundus sp.]|nr:glucosaminidase domain-containing protein [Mariprofundus sp.]
MYIQRFNPTLISPTLFSMMIWLSGMFLLSSCSTSNHSAQTNTLSTAAPDNSAQQKKQQFFTFLKPVIESENAHILQQRKKLLRLKSESRLSGRDLAWLTQLASEYGLAITGQPSSSNWQTLQARVDIIPVEMALVQAANESAWGTSRFAQQGNNYFGQWCYQKGCGIVPKHRISGATHEVQQFDNANHSVRAYMHNINTTRAYAGFRNIRQNLRVHKRPLNAEVLVVGLKSYSERGMAYVRIIQSMIRSNRSLIQSS